MNPSLRQVCGRRRSVRLGAIALGLVAAAAPAFAAKPKDPASPLDHKAFFRPEFYISVSHDELEKVVEALPNKAAWQSFVASKAGPVKVYIDPRSGAATNIISATPLLPGSGVGNRISLASLSRQLGRTVGQVDQKVVAAAVLGYVRAHQDVLGIDVSQLGAVRATQVTPDLWQIHIPQEVNGIPVRDGRLAASISHGNLVVIGTETWGNVAIDTAPGIPAEAALAAGFAYAEGPTAEDRVVSPPTLEIAPIAPREYQQGEGFAGPVGRGYQHRLVWTFVFQRLPDDATWEVMVDALSGEVLALQDINHYADIKGGVYPVTSNEICPIPGRCGIMQSGFPMPFTDTGFPAPDNLTNSAGVYNWPGGTATTTLNGRHVRITDTCGPISASSATGSIDLGGTNGEHDCATPGTGGAGNTASSRSAFYEVNKITEMARGYLPLNTWASTFQIPTNVNLNNTCNAFYSFAGSINFYRSGGGCRNTGEIAGVFDHEWGHALDDNDAGGALSNSSEGYADIAAIYRYQDSCMGHGFWWTFDRGCGATPDGTGFNANENQLGGFHCATDCSGVRDADWAKHADNTADTALGFVCTNCATSSGPCGRQVHCAAAPQRQAAWDLVARDLANPPFSLDSETRFIIGNKLFYQGSGNIGLWYACTCGGTSSACGATNGYMQWILADDDNGDLNDGTPHMTGIHAAFNRHGIACSTPAPTNSGCAAGPSAAPTGVIAAPGNNQVSLSWNAAPGATRYWVFRTEGHAGCDYGKALIQEVTGLSYVDTEVGNGRPYSYNVVAAGTSAACYSPAGTCATATPASCSAIIVNPSTIPAGTAGTAYSQTFTQTGGIGTITWSLTGTLPTGITLNTSTGVLSGTPTQTGSFPITVTATDANSCVGSRGYTLIINCQTIAVNPTTIPAGTAGSPYSQTFTTNGIGTIAWSLTGTLPTGITLNTSTGVLSGTPTQTGSFPITVTATDANNCTGSRGYTLGINCQTITVNPTTIPAGTAGSPYSQTFTQTSGIGTITWSMTGTLPTGITLNTSTGVLSGTPMQTGSFPITVMATDGNGCVGSRGYTLVINCQTIAVNPATIPAGTEGSAYSQTFTTNGIGTITWSLTGTLPTGITFNTSTGVLSGTPTQTGSFPITVTATDANACSGSGGYTLIINGVAAFVPIALSVDAAGNGVFQPNETVVLAPTWRNTGSAAAAVTGALTNHTGPAGATYGIPGAAASYGTVAAGATASCTSGNCYSVSNTVTTRPLTHWDSNVLETVTPTSAARTWILHIGDSFTDVPPSNGFYRFIETILHMNVTAGCTTTAYCPANSTTREQMAVFVLVSKAPTAPPPAACVAGSERFADVPASSPFCRWIEELARRGVVTGCGGNNYCPAASATREQMAVFVLRTLDPTMNPPACVPPNIYTDVPETSGFCRWIEELTNRHVVTGCGGGNYCPAANVTREEMSVFLAVTFSLALYGM